MILEKLLTYENIVIQCHDFPDADSIASGFALSEFLRSRGKSVRLIYSGRATITKPNLVLMIERLGIDISYIPASEPLRDADLLVTIDCQYGSGNVTKFDAPQVIIIDHHRVENTVSEYDLIESDMGSCSTVIWNLISKDNKEFIDERIGTALYYGLLTDTNMFAEIRNPLDKDLRDEIVHSDTLIRLLRNSNISVEELDIAGMAILRYSVNDDYRFAVIKSNPCDPNILGLIADFLLQVDRIDTCVVFAQNANGIKISVRSCVSTISASELAAFLCEDIGSGGGHFEKAGGFISDSLFNEKYPMMHAEAYFNTRMIEYHHSFDSIESGKEKIDVSGMKKYYKRKLKLGYVVTTDLCKEGTPIAIRTLEGDTSVIANRDTILMIGIKGEVYSVDRSKFERSNAVLDFPYDYDKYVVGNGYRPSAKDTITGEAFDLIQYAKLCETTGQSLIYARQIDKPMKVFTKWYKDGYMYGHKDDYLAIREDDTSDCYIVDKVVFDISYEEYQE